MSYTGYATPGMAYHIGYATPGVASHIGYATQCLEEEH